MHGEVEFMDRNGTSSVVADTAPSTTTVDTSRHRQRIAVALALWSLWYALYRGYYAVGGTLAMIGRPTSEAQFRAINAIGSIAILLFAGVLPLVAVRERALSRAVPVLAWIGAVGCCMHALVDSTLRILSITGVHPTQLPASAWISFDRHAADLQDLLLNEPWFWIDGLLWLALGLAFVHAAARPRWLASAVAMMLALTVIGVLSGLGAIGSFRVG
jgi:hypothetical protein